MIELDGTKTKSKLGANAILGVSLAVAKAASMFHDMPLYRYIGGTNAKVLPVPMMNIINGGSHSDAPIAFQEFMIRPIGATSFREGLRMGAEVFHSLKKVLKERGLSTAVGDEGGFAPVLNGTEDALESIIKAIQLQVTNRAVLPKAAMFPLLSIVLHQNFMKTENTIMQNLKVKRSCTELLPNRLTFLEQLINKYPIDSIEDGMSENDWDGWKLLTDKLGSKMPAGW